MITLRQFITRQDTRIPRENLRYSIAYSPKSAEITKIENPKIENTGNCNGATMKTATIITYILQSAISKIRVYHLVLTQYH